jgi:hypothetical protein
MPTGAWLLTEPAESGRTSESTLRRNSQCATESGSLEPGPRSSRRLRGRRLKPLPEVAVLGSYCMAHLTEARGRTPEPP